MRERSWSPSRMRGPGAADFAGGICSQTPNAAIYSLGAGGWEEGAPPPPPRLLPSPRHRTRNGYQGGNVS